MIILNGWLLTRLNWLWKNFEWREFSDFSDKKRTKPKQATVLVDHGQLPKAKIKIKT